VQEIAARGLLKVDAEVQEIALVGRDTAGDHAGDCGVLLGALAQRVVVLPRGRVGLTVFGDVTPVEVPSHVDFEVRVVLNLELAPLEAPLVVARHRGKQCGSEKRHHSKEPQ
jgi:hypothetical protein